ncbi:kinase-like protein [Hesseltinella vesiculosa]|uniref:non-specific serine/threonine protein kinase n=1 Tax=Hesseltinella vesiculosa TaxID=101127 RepID=A0A1X2G8V7_9FUNG|nr:kinase-like protein [Hesseltinella vesiculosa]
MTTPDYWTELSDLMIDRTVGDYQFVQDLGHGSYGGLFLGQSLKDNGYVAIKVLNKSGLNDEQRQLQQMEIDIQSSLHHPSLLALHSVLEDDTYVYMVMELCDQGDLFDFVINDQKEHAYCPAPMAKSLFLQILDAVAAMHAQGVYHRDIKLENILIKTGDDDTVVCKVADFGLATRDRMSMEFGYGSASYLAPEHYDDDDNANEDVKPYDTAAADVWSLGVLLLAMMFGRNPWQEANGMDPAFAEYKRNPDMLKQHLFPELSLELTHFLQRHVLNIDPLQRMSVDQVLVHFAKLTHLYAASENALPPMDIPAKPVHDAKPRYDSAFFSADNGLHGMSWADMVEDDLPAAPRMDLDDDASSSSGLSDLIDDDDDTDMFVHSDEKESWWL